MNAAYSSVRRVYVRHGTKQALNFSELRFHVSRETLLRSALIGLGPPEIGARIEGSYAVEKRTERWLSRAFGPGNRVS